MLEMDVTALRRRLADPNPITVVDVREDWEWTSSHIPQAVHIPLGEIASRLGELDKQSDVAFICHLGARSEQATELALAQGFKHAVNVTGGMNAWEAQHYETEPSRR